MTPHTLCGSGCVENACCPKRSSPSNQSITLQISPKYRTGCQDLQRNPHSQRKTWSPYFSFSSLRCIPKNCQLDSKTISTGQTSYCHQNQMPVSSGRSRSPPTQFLNGIFAIISPQKGPSQQTQSSQKQTCPCKRKRSMSSSRTSHILNICASVNDNTGSQEELPFKASVCHQMIHSLSIVTQSQSNHHVSLLTTSTISNDTFDIILNHSQTPPHQTGHSPYPKQNSTCIDTTFPKPLSSSDQKIPAVT